MSRLNVGSFRHPDATADNMSLDSSGRVLIGTTSDSKDSSLVLEGNSGNSAAAGVIRLARGTSTPGASDDLGFLMFGDSSHGSSATIKAQRDGGTWTSTSSEPTRLAFSTTADGASSPTERFRIGSAGQLGIGGATYGSSGQVLTSQGPSAAPQWASVATGTSTDATSLSSTGTVFDFTANTSDIIVITFNFTLSTNTEVRLRVGNTTSGTVNAGYKYYCVKDATNNPSSSSNHDKFLLMTAANTFGTYEFFGNMTLARAGTSGWSQSFTVSTPNNNRLTGSGLLTSAPDINRIHIFTSGATLGGYIGAAWH